MASASVPVMGSAGALGAFSCVLVGDGALLAECAVILQEAGHEVRGIVTANPQIAQWGRDRGITLVEPRSDMAGAVHEVLAVHGDEVVDLIFSVVNQHILDADALALARHGGINYHDAPLPRYAGMHATSWAILHGERRHAVSWHRVVERVDAGDVLKQVAVDVDPADTAYSLNAKCYVAAIDSFRELVGELASGRVTGTPQLASQRTYFGRLRRPPAASVVRWDRPAAELANLARGLELGPVANPLGRARLLLANDVVLAPRIEQIDGVSTGEPGTIASVDDGAIVVVTADGLVAIRELLSLDGVPLQLRHAAKAAGLVAGATAPIPDAETVARLEARDRAARRGEDAWVHRLRTFAPLELPYARGASTALVERRVEAVPAALRRVLAAHVARASSHAPGELLLAACATYFRRIADADGSDLGLVVTPHTEAGVAERRLFAAAVPVSGPSGLEPSFADAADAFLNGVAEATARGPLLRDVVTRYPELEQLAGRADALRLPVSLGLSDSPAESTTALAGSDLLVLVDREATTWSWCYDPARIDGADVARMMAHVETLLTGAAADPGCAVARLPLLPAAERALVLEEWNRTSRPYPREATIAQLVAAQVERTPTAIALVHGTTTLTYAELDARAERLAWHLRELGVGPDVRAGVCLTRTPELIVALLAVLKAGGAYVPLDPSYPPDRLAFMLTDSDAAVVVTESACADIVAGAGRRLVMIDGADRAPEQQPRGPVPGTATSANLAYQMYTSGSTGLPKGVMIEHRSVAAFIAWGQETFTERELAGVLFSTSICFDLSVFELFVTLSAGGSVILAEDALELPRLPAADRVTLVNTVPSAMAELVRMGGVPASVGTVNLCGEPLTTALVDGIYAPGTVERVHDLYGPTEDTVYSTWTLRRAGAPPTIGRSIANSYAYVLDAAHEPVPVGVPGELFLGGAGLARGYHARPELTAERFVRDPFSADPEARLYRTGDRVRWRADGQLQYLGRLDFQVKIRGFRVELGEIEARLLAQPGVRDVVVVAREDNGERRLVAYLVAAAAGSDSAVPTAELRAHLQATLPDYMIPAMFVWLPALPRTSNGKVDRRALPAPTIDRAALARPYAAPGTPTETALAEIWARVLRVEQVGVDDNFFELGGDSILMIQIVSLARRAGLALSPRELFRYPTVAELARVAEPIAPSIPSDAPAAESRAVLGAEVLSRLGVSAGEVEDWYPLSPMQQGLLFHGLAGSSDAEYQLQVRFTATGALDTSELRAAWEEVLQRHPVLRTAFVWEGVSSPIQVVLAKAALPWFERDWRQYTAQERGARFERLLDADREAGYDLAHAPLARVVVIRVADDCHEVVWSFHHLLLDGWSAHAVLHEVAEAYAARVAGQTKVPNAVRPYRDFIAELALGAPGQESFWRERLAGFTTPTPLGVDRRRTAPATRRYVREDLALTAEQTDALRSFAREHRITLNTLFQGAWAILLSRYSDSSDVVFGATVTTRPSTLDGVEHMVGLFLNTIPVRVQLGPEASVADWLRGLQREQSETRPYELAPLADIQRWSEVPQGASLFDSLLVFENYPIAEASAGTEKAIVFGPPDILERTHYPLTLAVIPGAQLVVRAMYDSTRFTPDAIDRLLAHLQTALRGIVSGAAAPADAVEILPDAERRQLLEWSATALPDVARETVHARFAAVAAARPLATALSTDAGVVSYLELDRRANRLAHFLRRAGVTPGAFVGLAMRPSVDLVAAILAVLKAGAAFVPLDPSSPAERLSYLLDDIAAPVVLTQRDMVAGMPARAGTAMLVVEDVVELLAQEPDGPPPAEGGPDDPAYVMYTSGSTGRPKGVVVPHRAIVRLVRENNFMHLDEEEVFLLLAPISFDASTLEIWGALLNGCRLVIPTSGVPAIERLGSLIREQGVTTIWLTAALFRHVVDTDIDALRPLRQLLAGGDVLPLEQVRRVLVELPGLRLINGYGPTENTTFTCCHPISAADAAGPSVPIGRPIANTTVYVLDRRMRPAPIGAPGELWTGGKGVALGYLNQPGMTAERFVDSPFRAGERLYRTGDRVRWRTDGIVEFLGRFDGQVKLRGFRVEPEEVETTLATHGDLLAAVVVVREDRPGEKRLVAYYVARPASDGRAPVDAAALRAYLGARLPDYMVPSAFVALDSLPVNANGKVDRHALPAVVQRPDEERGGYVAPRTEVESVLAVIWAEVLRVDLVGIHDNYFDLGGDSILSIQIAARARTAGLKLSISMLMKHHTVADLAAVLEEDSLAAVRADAGPSTGTAPLTPIQRWFFELDPAQRNHWNQTFLFRTLVDLDEPALRGAVAELLRHHDALRLRFSKVDGEWQQRYAPLGGEPPVWVEDLSAVPDADLAGAIAPITERAARSLDIGTGPCMRVVSVRLGGGRGGRLLIVVHHLVVDGISWRILLEDLEAAYRSLLAGRPVVLPSKTSSFQQWAADLSAHATSPTLMAERPYWAAVSEQPLLTLPVDGSRDAENTVREARTLVAALDDQETAELLQRVPSVYATQVNDVLLLALADALAPWAGRGALLLDLEGHGREEIVPDLDLTRTIGWFTSVFPVRLPLGGSGEVGERLKTMKEMLRRVPRRGVGYGSLRYLTADPEIVAVPASELVFNYLGQFDQLVASSELLRFASEDAGPWLAPEGRRRHKLEINSLVVGGRLEFRWTFGQRLHDEATVRTLAEAMLAALRTIIAHCRTPDAGGRTPSDFPLVALTQEQVDRLAGDGRSVEEIAPLVPMQALFLATSGGDTDVGFEQWTFEIQGALDVASFRRAWQLVAARHEILRTAFHADGLAAPVQVVLRHADLPFVAHDWRGLAEPARVRQLEQLLAADRATGFRVGEPPLSRLTLIRTGEAEWTLVWSNHHLLLDRWSWPIILNEVGIAYQAHRDGRATELPPATPWRRYLRWLAERDVRPTEAFWRAELAGMQPTPLPRLAGAGTGGGERRLELTPDETMRLAELAREHRVTVNVLISAAWALWLSRSIGRDDVTFGLAVAGRPEEVQGIERLVGMCINNVPSRVRLDAEETLPTLLARLEERQRSAMLHANASLIDLQRWSELPWRYRLFDTLVVFQHHGADDESGSWLGGSNRVRMIAGETRTNYPLALVVSGKQSLALRLAYEGRSVGAEGADQVLAELRAVLAALTTLGDAPVGRVLEAIPSRSVPLGVEAAPARAALPPRSDTEWVVAHVWAELLGRPSVGIDENFFELGGQSLVATQIVSRIRDGFQLELPISLLFEHPTVEAFARAVTKREPTTGRVERIAKLIRRVEDMTVQELRAAGIHD